MAVAELLAILEKGAEPWNHWRERNPVNHPDLRGAELVEADLVHANLVGVNLAGADLRRTDLSRADLRSAQLCDAKLHSARFGATNLSCANLSDSDLKHALFHETNLSQANLRGANLREAHFQTANLTGADLRGATFGWTIIADTNLNAAGLGSCNHAGPSSVGIDTIFKSKGAIPDGFLRGCGVPEEFVTFAPSLVAQPIQFYSCFISYSSHDRAFAQRLHADLRAKNLRCWFAPEDLKIGDRFQERIEESIRLFDKVMIVLSEASVSSPWVEREVNAAREREDREKRTLLFPVRIDDAVMDAPQPWAADIRRSRHIGDFRGWGHHSSYLKSFERLLRDLEAKPA